MPKQTQEICTIRIMFPVTTDETAVAIKQELKKALADVPDVHIQFMIMDNPASGS
ncbi:hypothetical protein ES703_62778 [subsurface metagenome]